MANNQTPNTLAEQVAAMAQTDVYIRETLRRIEGTLSSISTKLDDFKDNQTEVSADLNLRLTKAESRISDGMKILGVLGGVAGSSLAAWVKQAMGI